MRKNILVTGKRGFIGSRIKGGKAFLGSLELFTDVLNASKTSIGIVHLAGRSNKRICSSDPFECVQSNIIGLMNILKAAHLRSQWVLFVSTDQIKENHLYGLSKLMGEELCRLYNKAGLPIYILRLPIVYGKGESQDKVVSRTINRIKRGLKVESETNDKFHFAYVDDVVKMIESEVTVITGNKKIKPYSFRDLKDGIKEMLQTKESKHD